MKRPVRWWVVFGGALTVLALAGCSSKKTESQAPATTSQSEPSSAAPSGAAAHGETAETVMPAGTVGGIWTQIGDEQGKLTTAIQNGQLKDVHHLAFGIRDLVVALSEKASAASPSNVSKLKGMVEQVKTSAAKLDELGDAGNLSGTQAEFARLNSILSAIKTLTGAQ